MSQGCFHERFCGLILGWVNIWNFTVIVSEYKFIIFEKKKCFFISRAHFHPTWFPISIFFVFQGVKGPANGNQRYCGTIQALIILSY